jgi:DNA-binding transcriptional MerR regulator
MIRQLFVRGSAMEPRTFATMHAPGNDIALPCRRLYHLPMVRTYLTTVEVARAVGVHPNTVRLYEKWGFLPPIPRDPRNNYRRFTLQHVAQMRLARTALQWPYPGGKEPVLTLVYKAAAGDLGGALEHAYHYLAQVQAAQARAGAAATLLERWSQGVPADATARPLRIGEVAAHLGLSHDTLRSWERNGLLAVPRDPHNGYRLYRAADIARLRVIRMLREAGYSTMAILRMLLQLDRGDAADPRAALDTPRPDEDIRSVADHWLSTLAAQERRAQEIIAQLEALLASHN